MQSLKPCPMRQTKLLPNSLYDSCSGALGEKLFFIYIRQYKEYCR